LRDRRAALIGVLVSAVGLGVGVLGTIQMGSLWHPAGLLLYGLGFVLIGHSIRRAGAPKLGVATYVVAAFALLGAVDHGLIMVPYLPVSPALLRLLAELVWVPWVLVAALVARRPAGAPAAEAPEAAPAAAQ
jgi:hypothetical protein